ncbi:MAG: 4-(cytidine 5'-diphospho)-2-C-methyl-D-erythritol kinase [Pyrinomonadaceae bacterium]
MSPANVFTLPAFAKINRVLRVLGRRPDGYHEIRTVFQTVTLHDRLTFASRPDDRLLLTCDAPGIPVDETNLIHRAATALRQRYSVESGASIHLEKRIPAEGGLGGGSSDAAVALVGLTRLWEIETDQRELALIGAGLGADVPFFLTGGTALGTGLGTQITPLEDASAEYLLIVTPDAKVSTAEAYKALSLPALTKADGDIILSISCAGAQNPGSSHDALYNDFERVIFRLKPEIERAKNALASAGARGALLAGSGASVFGIFDNEEARESAKASLKEETGWLVFSCETLARQQYREALGLSAAAPS